MKPRVSAITIGVADLEQSLAFSRDGLGLPTEGIVGREFDHGAVAFFQLSGGRTLGTCAQDDAARCDPNGHVREIVSNPANTPAGDWRR